MNAKKKVTLEDVSRNAGVSLSSVSMILNARADVSFSPETVQKVRQAAKELGYRAPSRRAKGRLPGRNVVFIVTPNIANAYYSGLVQAIQQAAEERSFSTLIFTTYREAKKEEEKRKKIEEKFEKRVERDKESIEKKREALEKKLENAKDDKSTEKIQAEINALDAQIAKIDKWASSSGEEEEEDDGDK